MKHKLESFKQLNAWQHSMQLVKVVYILTKKFPSDERYGLISQMRRCAVSIPSNISEGYNRSSKKDYVRFLWMANGSIAELETQLLISKELGYLGSFQYLQTQERLVITSKMLKGLIRSLS